MERPCDSRAGKIHHLTKKYLIHLKQALMDLCHREHLNQVDLLTPAERNISEKEYWADRRGQKKLEEQNRQLVKDGINPRTTRFQTQKEFLRSSIEQAFSESKSLAVFSRKALKAVENQLTKVNEQIHYTGQYLVNKAVCSQFRMEHPTEIALYESARHFLKDHSGDGRLPSMRLLKAEKERLLKERQDALKSL